MGFNQHKITTNYTQILSEYIKNTKYEDLPPEVVERAKIIITQVIGVSLAAKNMGETRKAIELAREANAGGGGDATGWVSGDTLSLENACMLNGALADMLDWEDTSCTGHPSCGIVPVAWTVGEGLKLSGKDVITAVVVGYEVYQRIALAVQPSKEERPLHGWGLTSWQIFGSLVPALKLMGHDTLQINKALGMATTCTPIPTNLHEYTKSDVYHFEHGFRNKTAITLARCALLGVQNLEDGLDDFNAFGNVMTADHKPEWYTKELGERYLIMNTLLKHWPANMWVQTPVEVAYNLAQEHNIAAEDVEEVIVDPGVDRRMDPIGNGFSSITHAQFNVPYVIAAMLLDRTPGSAWYTEENMKNPKVIELAKRVHAGDSPVFSPITGFRKFVAGEMPQEETVTIRTKDGKSYTGSMACHPGHPLNMMDRAEIASRFRIQSAPVLDAEKAEKAIDALLHLEECEDVSTLSWMLH